MTSQEYRDSIQRRACAGSLTPQVECLLLHYAFGKPREEVQVDVRTVPSEFSGLSLGDMIPTAKQLVSTLEQLSETRDEIDRELEQLEMREGSIPAEFTTDDSTSSAPVIQPPPDDEDCEL